MPYRFVNDPDPENPREKQKVPGIAKKLLSDDAAMRGLLQLAVTHAQGLIERNGEYSMPEGPEERFKSYTAEADPIVRFARKAFEQGGKENCVAKEDAYHVYRQVMDIWRERTTSEDSFKRYLPRCVSAEIETSQSRALADDDDDRDRVQVWKRLRWTEDAAEFMPDWIAKRYSDQFGDDADLEVPEDTADDEVPALASRDPGYGHDLEATITTVSDGEYSRKAQGRLSGPHDTYISYVVPGGNDIEMSAYEHHTVQIEDATLRTNDDGLLEAVLEDAVTISKTDSENSDTDTDNDDDPDRGSNDATLEPADSPATPETTHTPSSNTETAADGGETSTADTGTAEDENTSTVNRDGHDDSPTLEPDSIRAPDENAPDTQAERLQMFKDTLNASTKNNEWLTGDDLEDRLGWNRSTIDGFLEKLQRESTLMGDENIGWKYYK
jgi:hypothetical protein